MLASNWFGRGIAAILIVLLIIAGCGIYQYADSRGNNYKTAPRYVINQSRLIVSDMLLYVERHHGAIQHGSEARETLRRMSLDKDVQLLVAGLDGGVIFDSSAADTTSGERLDLRTALHYDLYSASADKNTYKAAFPVVDKGTGAQVGNAVFTLPAGALFMEPPNKPAALPFVVMGLSIIALFLILLTMRRRMKRNIIQPIHKLKDYSEAIMRGDYGQKAEYGRMDEIGEVYAMFDQMRMEIRALHNRRNEQDKAQKELITNISHDIKTPLTTLKAYIEAIREGVCPDMPAVMKYIAIMETNTDKMTRLVEDLLIHALKELGQISVHPTEQYSRSVLQAIIGPIAHYVRTTGVVFEEPTDIPNVLIAVDANRLEQVISNLVANALKHTTAGDKIRMSAELESEGLKVTISDTGGGIHPQDMPFIFERYYQGKGNADFAQSAMEGSGLGLSICKHIVEAHGGAISFRSAKGQGTTFYFTLPYI